MLKQCGRMENSEVNMKKRDIILAVIVIIIATALFILVTFKDEIFKKDTAEDITLYQEWYDTEVSNDSDVYGYDIEHTPQDTFVSIVNVDIVYNDLTLQALSSLRQECETYLFNNGYNDARTLTINEESITGDKTYYSFDCQIAEYPNTTLSVTYILNDKKYEFAIK